ncbi:hypothetical protein VNO78_09721 [Psophocarpus tetragonolobus]|uniref:Uncharacterized protein n=1 Tax=Psophocarpus tetragonolobus TaxID=3891 RepID=A0AAN9SYQ7_PSOTE
MRVHKNEGLVKMKLHEEVSMARALTLRVTFWKEEDEVSKSMKKGKRDAKKHWVWVPSMTWHKVQCDIQLSTVVGLGAPNSKLHFNTFNVILSNLTQPIMLLHVTIFAYYAYVGACHWFHRWLTVFAVQQSGAPSVGDIRLG